jgi:hypothetical protein
MLTLPPEPITWTLLVVSGVLAVGLLCAAADVPLHVCRGLSQLRRRKR